jgi:hypothetical protein
MMSESQSTTQESQTGQGHQTDSDTLEPFRHSPFTEPVAELERLLSQSQRVFLMGAGCSKCAGLPLMPELTKSVLDRLTEQPKPQAILQGLQQNFKGSTQCTIEDYMSELVDLVCIADRRQLRGAQDACVLLDGQTYSADDLLESLAAIKDAIADSITNTPVAIDVHRQFVRAIHGTLLSGKSGSVRQVDYFTMNYDTLLEDALALERTPLADGFNGGVTGWWDSSSYRDLPAEARVFKIHGSIDWCLCDTDVLPRRVRHGLPFDGQRERVLIWPASTKYRETQRDPYAQILDFMRKALRPPKNAEVVLTICGYAFGDAHINIEVDRALHESEGRLTVIAFTSEDEPFGQLKAWLDDSVVREQVRIHSNCGFFHADSQRRSERPLLWWQFETLTRLLGGQR